MEEKETHVYKTTVKSPGVDMRKHYANPKFEEMDLIEYDMTRDTHQARFMELLDTMTMPVFGKGLDKVGRMVLFLYNHKGKVIIYQNGQWCSAVYDTLETRDIIADILVKMKAE